MATEFRWEAWNVNHIGEHGIRVSAAEYVVRKASTPYPRKIEDEKYLVHGQDSAELPSCDLHLLAGERGVRDTRAAANREREEAISPEPTMKNPKKSYFDRFMAMTDAQRDAEVARLDHEFMSSKPLSSKDRVAHQRAGLKVGRPKVGQGAKRFSITLEQGLAKQADELAKEKNLSRSELIARGLQFLLKAG